MQGKQFIRVAEQLLKGEEPHWRSAVSRAYYAAFHTAREALALKTLPLPGGPADHKRVPQCLNYSGNASLQVQGTALSDLHKKRNDADYELVQKTITPKEAELYTKMAKEVIAALGASPLMKDGDESKAVVERIREYLKKTGGAAS